MVVGDSGRGRGEVSHLEDTLGLIIDDAGLPEFKRNYHFDKPRSKREMDFAWPEYKVGVEVQGGIWARGAHTRGAGYMRDCSKLDDAQLQGWILLWVTAHHIEHGKALVWIRRALTERGWRDA